MLNFYLTTVLIWFIIVFASAKLTAKPIKENGWTNPNIKKNLIKGMFGCLLIAAVPVVRLLAVIGMYVLAFNKKEENN